MTAWSRPIGTTMGLALLASFPALLAVLPGSPDLRVRSPSSQYYVVRADSHVAIPTASVEPVPAPEGLRVTDTTTGPGLALRTWDVTYSHRWEREVTLPVLTGPFVEEGTEVCGISIAIGAGLFDTSGAGSGLQSMISHVISDSLPYTYVDATYPTIRITFEKPRRVDLGVRLFAGYLAFAVRLSLNDGTRINLFFRSRLIDVLGAPALVRIGPISHEWSGPTYDKLLLEAANLGANAAEVEEPIWAIFFGDSVRLEGARRGMKKARIDGNLRAQLKLTKTIDDAISIINTHLSTLNGPYHPITSNANATVRLRLAEAPTISPSGISLRVCAAMVAGSKVDAAIAGSVGFGARPTAALVPCGDAGVEVSADGNTLNQALYFLWQSGALRQLGTSQRVLQAVLEGNRDAEGDDSALQKLAFEFTGFDPGLPPTIMPETSLAHGLGIALGDVRIGDWGDQRVVAHAVGLLALDTTNGDVSLSASFGRIAANCTGRLPSGVGTLTPCVSDLMTAARSSLVGRPFSTRVSGDEVLSKLPRMTFDGGELQLSKLDASTETNPARLSLRVQARVTGSAP